MAKRGISVAKMASNENNGVISVAWHQRNNRVVSRIIAHRQHQ
jgi:hypothetical protein